MKSQYLQTGAGILVQSEHEGIEQTVQNEAERASEGSNEKCSCGFLFMYLLFLYAM